MVLIHVTVTFRAFGGMFARRDPALWSPRNKWKPPSKPPRALSSASRSSWP